MKPFSKHPVLALAATAALVLGTSPPASAAISVSSYGNVYSDAAGDIISVSCVGGDLYASGLTAGDDCAALTSVYLSAGGGTDTVSLSGVTATDFPAITSTTSYLDDTEADSFTGSPLKDFVTGDSYDSVDAGGGDDRIKGAKTAVGGFGDDVISDVGSYASGGPGDDRIVQTAPLGGVDGGDGYDTWEIDFDLDSLGVPYPSIVFDVSASALVLSVPSAGLSQSVPISGLEHLETVLPRTVPTTWNGSTFSGSQDVRALTGAQVLLGGAFADALHGGPGDDALTGGGGADVLDAGSGNDSVQARDGVADQVSCGDGTDTVVADASDVVSGCESVQLPPVVTPPPPPPVTPATSSITGAKSFARPDAAKFRFSSPTAGAGFECKVDKGRWKSCTSPHKVATKKLDHGRHTLRVRAVVAGVVDPTPSVKRFRITR